MGQYSKDLILQELKAVPDTTSMTIAKAARPWLQDAENFALGLGNSPSGQVRLSGFLLDSLLGGLPETATRLAEGESGVLAKSAPTMRGGSANPLNYRVTPAGAEVAGAVAPFAASRVPYAVKALRDVPGRFNRGRVESIYEPGLMKWDGDKLVPTPPESGEATTAMLDAIDRSGVSKAYERLDAGRWPGVAGTLNKIDSALSQATGDPVRQDLMRLREIISTSGFSGLRAFVQQHGATGLPALAGLGILGELVGQERPDN